MPADQKRPLRPWGHAIWCQVEGNDWIPVSLSTLHYFVIIKYMCFRQMFSVTVVIAEHFTQMLLSIQPFLPLHLQH